MSNFSQNLSIKHIYEYTDQNGNKTKFCYVGDTENSNEVYAGEIGTIDNSRKFISLSNGMRDVLFMDKLLKIKLDNSPCRMYLSGKILSVTSSEFQTFMYSIIDLLIEDFNKNIYSISNNNFNSGNQRLNDIMLSEKLIRLIEWMSSKAEIKFLHRNLIPNIYKNDVYFANLGCNVGCEMEKERPVLIWKEHRNLDNYSDSSFYVFPITSKHQRRNYTGTVPIIVNGVRNYIKISDGRRISVKRITRPLYDSATGHTYKISDSDIELIKNEIKKYFRL